MVKVFDRNLNSELTSKYKMMKSGETTLDSVKSQDSANFTSELEQQWDETKRYIDELVGKNNIINQNSPLKIESLTFSAVD